MANRAAKQRILLNYTKQTTSQNAYVLYESLAGITKEIRSANCSSKQLYLLSSSMQLAPDVSGPAHPY